MNRGIAFRNLGRYEQALADLERTQKLLLEKGDKANAQQVAAYVAEVKNALGK